MPFFCPNCQIDFADADVCPACGQPRPETPAAAPRWTVALELTTYGTLTAAGDLLFLLTSEGSPAQHATLLALDLSTQETHWRCRLENLLVNDPALAHSDTLYLAARSADPLGQGLLLALNLATGDERWRWAPGAQAVSAPALIDDLLYVTSNGDQLWAVDAGTGNERWHLTLPMPRSVAAPAVSPEAPGQLFLPSRGPHLCAVDVAKQAVAWHHHSPDDAGAWFLETPALAAGRVFAASTGGAVLALDVETGKRLWRVVPGQTGKPLTVPVTDGERIYAGSRDHCIYALDVESGETLWQYETARRIEGRPLLLDDVLYVTGHDHRLRALDAATGRELWHIELPCRIEGSPAVAGDLILAADRGGNVVAVERSLAAQPPDPLQAAEEYAAAGAWAEAGEAYEHAGHPDLAGSAFKKAGLAARAADNYRQAEMWADAAYLYETLEQWPDAADCYGQAERWADAGRIQSTQLKNWATAAISFVQAAQSAKASYIAAGYWERARDCYRQLDDEEGVNECQRKIARLRRLPYIQIRVEAEEAMTLGEYHEIVCEVSNVGGGLARYVFLRHTESEFTGDLQATREIRDLPPDGEPMREELYLRPLAAGRRVPLDLIVTYADTANRTYEVHHRELLTVQRAGATLPPPSNSDAAEGLSLRRQLAEARENLRLIEEQKAKYVLQVDVPLQLVKEERRLRRRIAELARRLGMP